MAQIIVAMLSLLLAAGCAATRPNAPYHENSTYDAAAGTHLVSMNLNLLETYQEWPGVLAFDAFRLEGPAGVEWTVDISYMAKDWLFILGGASLTILADGRATTYSGKGSDPQTGRAVLADNSIVEQAIYPMSMADLRAIAGAKEVVVKAQGSRGYGVGRFTKANFERLRSFLDRYGAQDQ